MALIRSIATVGGLTLVSRVLGFARDVLMAAGLGAGWIADAFFVAFKLPNLFRRLFAEGAFSAAFVPLYSEKLEKEGKSAATFFAEQAQGLLFWSLLVITLLFEMAMPWVMMAFAPGFVDDPEKFGLTVTLSRITFPYLILISLVALLGGMLNALGKFAAMAATPVLLNLCMIAGVSLSDYYFPHAGYALAWAVAFAGLVQFAFLFWAASRQGVMLRLLGFQLSPEMKRLLALAAPGVIGAGVTQINLVIDMILASTLGDGAVSYLFFGDRLNQLPLGVVGIAVGTALLPILSRHIAANEEAEATIAQNRALEFALLLCMPAAAALIMLAEPIIITLFQRGAFTLEAAQATAGALQAYAVGLPAYIIIKVMAPGFFARQDTKTPVKISMVAVGVNVVLNLALIGPLEHVGLALATAIAAWVNAIALMVILYRQEHFRLDQRSKNRLPRQIIAVGIMCGFLWVTLDQLPGFFEAGGEAGRFAMLLGICTVGLVLYLATAHLLRGTHLKSLLAELKGRA